MTPDEEKLERAILEYMSRDDEDSDRFQSLTTIYEQMARPYAFRNSYFDQAPEVDDKEYVRTLLDQMVADGLLETRMGERDYERSYKVTDQGIYERSFEDLPLVRDVSSPRLTDGSDFATDFINDPPSSSDREARGPEPIRVNSASWTGLKQVRIDARNAKVVGSLIGQAMDLLSESENGNQAIMQAAAYLRAAKALVEAPEPPSVVIWNLLEKAAAIAGLAQLFAMIFSQAAS